MFATLDQRDDYYAEKLAEKNKEQHYEYLKQLGRREKLDMINQHEEAREELRKYLVELAGIASVDQLLSDMWFDDDPLDAKIDNICIKFELEY